MTGIDDPATYLALISLTAMEIVLGIDNIVFISILTSRLPPDKRAGVTRIGLGLAMFLRIGLLFTISLIMGLTSPLFSVFGHAVTTRDLVLIAGGAFLVAKATTEIHSKVEGEEQAADPKRPRGAAVTLVIAQILALDLVFSLDSVITAVGMVSPDRIWVMVCAVVISVGVMLAFASRLSAFVLSHPSVKLLALAFLMLIGVMLVADGMGHHIPKGYIYFAMAFALGVELLNMRFRSKRTAEAGASPRAAGGSL